MIKDSFIREVSNLIDIKYLTCNTVSQSICTHYFCFEYMGPLVTLKKVPKYGLLKAWCKKQGHCYLKYSLMRKNRQIYDVDILRPSLVICWTSTLISFTKWSFRWSFWSGRGASENVWAVVSAWVVACLAVVTLIKDC